MLRYTPLLALFVVFAVLVAGCGGQSGGNSGQSDGGGGSGSKTEKKATPAAGQAAAPPQMKIALGTITNINAGERRMYLRPSGGGEVVRFRIVPEPEVTVDGKSAELTAVKEGQQAKVEYIVRKDLGRARTLDVFGG